VLFTTRGAQPYTDFTFQAGDTLIFGRESAGVMDEVHERAQARLLIPMRTGARSINVVTAAAMALGEALRQTQGFPVPENP
jgi:tRNA (cytidine/uridine-2'-O-)-methyltransferase